MTNENPAPQRKGRLIKRQRLSTRITHWIWATCLFFLLLSGLQIFNAHPTLYIGNESGVEYDNAILAINSPRVDGERIGATTIFGKQFNTTGVLGLSGTADNPRRIGFPAWATIPSSRDLSTGRVVHFFFAWIFVATIFIWFVASLFNRHLRKDLLPKKRDFTGLVADLVEHIRFRFHHTVRYSPLQKFTYAGVLFILFPGIVLTGLAMSPGMDALMPWLIDLLGGRQTARTLHFVVMALLVLFFIVHIAMVIAAGPINELRSMITGRYRLSPPAKKKD